MISQPLLWSDWTTALTTAARQPDHGRRRIALLVFPKLALGLSGFETGVAVMPHINGEPDDDRAHPAGRIRGARHLLTAAAATMSVFLITSSIVTTLLIPPAEFQPGGPANGRALAYLAHRVPGKHLRQRLRRLDDRHPVVRWSLRHGRPAQPHPALPAPLRNGSALDPGRTAAGPDPHPRRLR